jgi:hypothetical protein
LGDDDVRKDVEEDDDESDIFFLPDQEVFLSRNGIPRISDAIDVLLFSRRREGDM